MASTTLMRFLGLNVGRRCLSTTPKTFNIPRLDPIQEQALDKEYCILVDGNDKAIGSASKRDCHVVGPDGAIPLHRAFSIFLFNSKGDILLQRRGKKKVTFPDVYANACCSHPLWLGGKEEDIMSAVQRRLSFELGIPREQLSPNDFTYLTRIHYHHTGDGKWGEHEMDYIFIIQKDVDLNPNENEIDEVLYIPKDKFDETLSKLQSPLSPWFKLVLRHRLRLWWDNLHQLEKYQEHKTIHRLS